MKRALLVSALLTLLLPLSAQNIRTSGPTRLPFCPPKTCLYYAGDFDSANSAANYVYNATDALVGLGQAWLAVKPTRDVTVTGVTFQEIFAVSMVGINPAPFQVYKGMTTGYQGTQVCNSKGHATMQPHGESFLGLLQYSFTIERLKPACELKKGIVYYLNLLPTYSDNSEAFLLDVEDHPAPNHRGWPNVWDDSYYFGLLGDIDYFPTWGNNGVCASVGCDLFSFALTGRKH